MIDEKLHYVTPERRLNFNKLSLSQSRRKVISTHRRILHVSLNESLSTMPASDSEESCSTTGDITKLEVNKPSTSGTNVARIKVKSLSQLRDPLVKSQEDVSTKEETLLTPIENHVIQISSDEETDIKTAPEEKPKRTRKPRMKEPKTEIKVVPTRKLTNSTNLKTFPSKFLPKSQKRIDDFFLQSPDKKAVSYFQTFAESKQMPKDESDSTVSSYFEVVMKGMDNIKEACTNAPVVIDGVISLPSDSEDDFQPQKKVQKRPLKFSDDSTIVTNCIVSSHDTDLSEITSCEINTCDKISKVSAIDASPSVTAVKENCDPLQSSKSNEIQSSQDATVAKAKPYPNTRSRRKSNNVHSQISTYNERITRSKTINIAKSHCSSDNQTLLSQKTTKTDEIRANMNNEGSSKISTNQTLSHLNTMSDQFSEPTESIDYAPQNIEIERINSTKIPSRMNRFDPYSTSELSSIQSFTRVRKRLSFKTGEDNSNSVATTLSIIPVEEIDLTNNETPKKKQKFTSTLSKSLQTSVKSSTRRKCKTTMKKTRLKRGECPSYKIIEGTTFAVDAFRYGDIEGVTDYFLTHYHADHYIGLTKKFSKPIYLSPITARLVQKFIRTSPEYLHVIELNTPIIVNEIEVVAIDANHCPGAVMFFFKLPSGICTLHTGDFRANPEMEQEPLFWNNQTNIIYLDTTYLSSHYAFKSQEESIFDVECAVDDFRKKHIGERILYICGSYVIGKEKVWTNLSEKYGFRVWTEGTRRQALEAIGDCDILKYLVNDPRNAQMHLIALGNLSYDYLVQYLDQYSDNFDIVLAIRPSGWEKNSRPQYRGKINIIGIEYSEHSSYTELRRFVRFLQPVKIISTVASGSDANKTSKIPNSWYNNELRCRKKGYQSSITNFVGVSGSMKNLPPSTSAAFNELENAKFIDSCDEIDMLDATLTVNNDTPTKKQSSKVSEAETDWLP